MSGSCVIYSYMYFLCLLLSNHVIYLYSSLMILWGFPGDSAIKYLPANAGDVGSIPGLGRSLGEGNDNPLQYSHLGNLP